MLKEGMAFHPTQLTIASERIADAEAIADRQRKLAVKQARSQGRYDPGI